VSGSIFTPRDAVTTLPSRLAAVTSMPPRRRMSMIVTASISSQPSASGTRTRGAFPVMAFLLRSRYDSVLRLLRACPMRWNTQQAFDGDQFHAEFLAEPRQDLGEKRERFGIRMTDADGSA